MLELTLENFLEIAAGTILVTAVLFDIFQAVLVPRFTPASMRLTPNLIGRFAWPCFRKLATFVHNETLLDHLLGMFAPLVFVMVFSLTMLCLVAGYGMIVHGLGTHFSPIVHDYGTACYASATALLTLGFGDIVATGPAARMIMLLAASTGISIVAIAVSFLFSMQQNVHTREQMVHALQVRVIPDKSAVGLLLTYADLGIKGQLVSDLSSWELWMAQVLTSHRSFPLLCYFRSGHMCVPWVTILGIILDLANLLSTTVNERRFGHAAFLMNIGNRMLSFFRSYFSLSPVTDTSVSRDQFAEAYALLKERGYLLHDEDEAWERFHVSRSAYAPTINAMCYQFICAKPGFLPSNMKSSQSIANEVSIDEEAVRDLKVTR